MEGRRGYAVYGAIGKGGTGAVHVARLIGPRGFGRLVAVKRLLPGVADEPNAVAALVDEARLMAAVRHANVAAIVDLVEEGGMVYLVLDYIHGESLARLMRSADQSGHWIPRPVALAILAGALRGLHAAHEACEPDGAFLGIVHRDVSPQNVVVGVDGQARMIDFGVAKAVGRLQTTKRGVVKGKFAYMAPEQVRSGPIDRRVDIWAAGVMLWELLAADRLFDGDNDAAIIHNVLHAEVRSPGAGSTPELEDVVRRALQRDPARRFATARQMADAIEAHADLAAPGEVGRYVEKAGAEGLAQRDAVIAAMSAESPLFELSLGRSMVGPLPLPDGPLGERVGSEASTVRDAVGAGSDAEPLRRRRRRWPLLAAGLVLAAGVVGLAAQRSASRSAAPADAGASATAPDVAAAIAIDAGSVAVDAVAAGVSSAGGADAATGKATGSRTVKKHRPKAHRPKKPSCDPPYTLTPDGHKHFRAECLRKKH